MSFALFASPAMLAPLQGIFRWFGPAASTVHRTTVLSPAFLRPRARPEPATRWLAIGSVQLEAPTTQRAVRSPVLPSLRAALPAVRVVRMLEAGQPRASVGRMVISGRMADVCAELDRLVGREESLH